ncbi:hypothetical protein ACWCQQ_15760 [Streptomyces sp. NPDC002143]
MIEDLLPAVVMSAEAFDDDADIHLFTEERAAVADAEGSARFPEPCRPWSPCRPNENSWNGSARKSTRLSDSRRSPLSINESPVRAMHTRASSRAFFGTENR